MITKPTAVDLFSGCGGMTVGLKQAGFRVLGAVDNDSVAVETYRMNHPEVTVWGADIRSLDATVVRRTLDLRAGDLDVLAGCPPCQGFSRIRTLNGAAPVKDRRNKLVLDMIRFVEVLKPKSVIFENVPGLATDHRFIKFRRSLRRLGYQVDHSILNAADCGVPQRRKRLFLVALLGRPITLAPTLYRRRTVRETIGRLKAPGTSGDPLHDVTEQRSKRIRQLIRSIPPDGGSRKDLGPRRQLACHRRSNGFKDIYGRISWDDVAPTITGGFVNPSKGRFLHPESHRTITLREAALIQSFPRYYRVSLSKGKFKAAEMIGNAVPPGLVRCQAVQLRKGLRTRMQKRRRAALR
jgi:DNA (cytosine-5)-methyltransferase 1